MKRSWIKLYIEIVDDPKMGRLPDHLWRRAVEFFLLAGEQDADGLLPSEDDMAWRLRTNPGEISETLKALTAIVLEQTSQGWLVSKFKDRQYSESYERVKRYRNAKSNEDETENESPSSSSSQEGGGTGEETTSNRIPETQRQAASHPDIMVYEQVSGMFPGIRNYQIVIETIQFLRKKHGDQLVEFLKPYWSAWSTRRTKDNKPYSKTSPVWLCEWAVQGSIPSTNGREPSPAWTPIPSVEATRKMLEEKDELRKKASTGKSIKELTGRMTTK